jgi:hypothetical protein
MQKQARGGGAVWRRAVRAAGGRRMAVLSGFVVLGGWLQFAWKVLKNIDLSSLGVAV